MPTDTILSVPVGEYKYLPTYSSRPIYCARKTYLTNNMLPEKLKEQYQVLVSYLGQLEWINVNKEDFTLYEGR